MAELHYGNVSIKRDGNLVRCVVAGAVVGSVEAEDFSALMGRALVFDADHTYWLSEGELRCLFDAPLTVDAAPAEVVAEAAAEAAAEPAAEVAADEAPAPTKRRRR